MSSEGGGKREGEGRWRWRGCERGRTSAVVVATLETMMSYDQVGSALRSCYSRQQGWRGRRRDERGGTIGDCRFLCIRARVRRVSRGPWVVGFGGWVGRALSGVWMMMRAHNSQVLIG